MDGVKFPRIEPERGPGHEALYGVGNRDHMARPAPGPAAQYFLKWSRGKALFVVLGDDDRQRRIEAEQCEPRVKFSRR